MGDVHEAVDRPYVVYLLELRAQSAVRAKDLVVHDRSQGKAVKYLCKQPPHAVVPVLLNALIIEAIQFISVRGLVVAPQDCDSVFVPD